MAAEVRPLRRGRSAVGAALRAGEKSPFLKGSRAGLGSFSSGDLASTVALFRGDHESQKLGRGAFPSAAEKARGSKLPKNPVK